jgi:hypothetical protein
VAADALTPLPEPTAPVARSVQLLEAILSALGIVATLAVASLVSQAIQRVDLGPLSFAALGVGALVATAVQVVAYRRIRAHKALFSHPLARFVFELLQFLALGYIIPFLLLGVLFLWGALVVAILGPTLRWGEIGLALFLLSLAPWFLLALRIAKAIFRD